MNIINIYKFDIYIFKTFKRNNKMSQLNYLSDINKHDRDSHITFDEGPHIYTIDGDSDYLSVTTWNHSHFKEFNADRIIDRMMNSKNWVNSEYYGMSKEEIKNKWNKNRDEAAEAGTKMHYDIECYYNNVKVNNNSTEFEYFDKFTKDFPNLKPYRTEWMVWDADLKLAGSIDMLFINENNELEIYDWKRCKNIKKDNKWDKAKTKCISHIQDTNYWHYALQLNTYKAILEKNYDKKISKMCLICLHPNNENNNYLRYELPDLTEEINSLFEYRKLMLTNHTGLKLDELHDDKKSALIKIEKYKKYIDNLKNKILNIDTQINELINNDTENYNLEVSTYIFDEQEYLVDDNTGKIYSYEGSYIGNWYNNKPILF